MRRTLRKATSIFLALTFILALMPAVTVFASDTDQWDVSRSVFIDYNTEDYPSAADLPYGVLAGSIGHSAETNTIGIASGSSVLGSYSGNIPSKGTAQKRAGNWNDSSSSRGSQANFHVPVESNYRITMEFDWYPGTTSGTGNTAYGALSIADNNKGGFSNSGGTQDDQFINFISSTVSGYTGLYYRIGNMLDVTQYRVNGGAGAVSPTPLNDAINGGASTLVQIGTGSISKTTWYNISITFDFQARTLQFTFKNAQTDEVVFTSPVHNFAHEDPDAPDTWPYRYHATNENGTPIERQSGPLTYKNQIGNFRFYNAGSGWQSQIDNIRIEAYIPFVPPVLSNPSNLNPAKGTLDITIDPYSVPEGSAVERFNIYAKTDGGEDTLVKTVYSTGVHTINVPRGNATHVITAEAVIGDGTVTNRSNALTVEHTGVTTPKPGTVTGVNFTVVNGKIDLSWAPVANADEYVIYRAFFERSAFEKIGTVYDATSFTDIHSKLTNTASTYYKIEAIGDGGSGGLSGVFASTKSGYQLIERESGKKDRALTAVNLAGNKGAEILVSATGPDGEELTSGVYLSWRWYEADEGYNTTFTLYKNGAVLASGLTVTNLVDPDGSEYDIYRIEGASDALQNITAPDIRVWNDYFQELQLYQPPMQIMANGNRAYYKTNDIIAADLTGDGTLDIIVKWYPTNGLDASAGGQTATTIFDAYTVDWNTGETVMLWRVDLGTNVRSSAHFAQFGAADFRGIGRSDVMMTASTSARSYRSVDGTDRGLYENMSATRVGNGNIGTIPTGTTSGITHITAVDGVTGEFIHSLAITTDHGSRWNGVVAYLRGHDQTPSFVTGGQYGSSAVREYRFNDEGTAIVSGWSATGLTSNHNMIAADLHGTDAEGNRYDSIIMGASVVVVNATHTGLTVLHTNGVHGDAMHVGNWIYDESQLNENGYPRQYLTLVQENPGSATNRYSAFTRDILTNTVMVGWNGSPNDDTGRGAAADVDPTSKNAEMWAANGPRQSGDSGNWNLRIGGLYSMENYGIARASAANDTGDLTKLSDVSPSMNFTLFWDGDLLSELQDHDFNEQVGYVPVSTNITKWDYVNNKEIYLFLSDEVYTINGTKGNPNLQGDILGDWREEVIFRDAKDDSKVRLYMTTIQTDYVLPHLMEDHNYNNGIQSQHSTYNQPPNTSYLPSAQTVTPRELDYSTVNAASGVIMRYTPANDGEYGFEITGHQLWRKDGGAGTFDLTPKGSLSDSSRLQLEAAGYVKVAEVSGSGELTDATALVGREYSYVVIGVSGDKLSYIGHSLTAAIEDRSAGVTSVTVAPAEATLTAPGATVQLNVTILPENAQNKNVVWSSSNENAATVDANGLVTAVGNGKATITATSVSGGLKSSCAVTVEIPTFIVSFMLDAENVYVVRDVFQNVAMGGDMVLNPYKAGYTFEGWFDTADSTGGTQFTSETVVTGDITVYARFKSAGTVVAGDRFQFTFQGSTTIDSIPSGWTAIPTRSSDTGNGNNTANASSASAPLGAWNDSNWGTDQNTPIYPSSKAEIGSTGVYWGVTTNVWNMQSDTGTADTPTWTNTQQWASTRSNQTGSSTWYGKNADGLTAADSGTDRFGNAITIPRTVATATASNFGLLLDLPNGAYDVYALIGEVRSQGGASRGSLIFHNEPAELNVARTANATNAPNQRVMVSREMSNPPEGDQNAKNGAYTSVKLNAYNNVMVDNGYMSIETGGFNLCVSSIIIVAYALHAPVEEAISEAGKLNRADYTVASWANLEAAIAAGQAATTKGGANEDAYNQAEIDAFAQAIRDAIEALVPNAGPSISFTVNYSGFVSLVSGYAANIPVTVDILDEASGQSVSAGLFVDGKLIASVPVVNGKATIKAPAFTGSEAYLAARFDGAEWEMASRKNVPLVQLPANIWSLEAVVPSAGGRTVFVFGDVITLTAKAAVTIDGAAVKEFSADGHFLHIEAESVEGQKIVMSGIKYPDLFPSYSFTFTVVR